MSWTTYDDNCPGCKPAILNLNTGLREPDDSPVMRKVLDVWAKATLGEKEAFHNVCCLNSSKPSDLELFDRISLKIQGELSQGY